MFVVNKAKANGYLVVIPVVLIFIYFWTRSCKKEFSLNLLKEF